jgi:adenylate kinase
MISVFLTGLIKIQKNVNIKQIMDLNTIFFIGPQGSGKGTQAKLLAKKLDFFYWEMGGILREIAKDGSELGNQVKGLIEAGILLEDTLLLEVVKKRLSLIPLQQGLIFDGIPRRLAQAEFLLGYLNKIGRTNFVTLFIDLPKPESLSRLLKRAEVEKRADDTKDKIEFRLDQYYKETLPVVDFLKIQTKTFTIDGTPSVEEVTKEINKQLGIS